MLGTEGLLKILSLTHDEEALRKIVCDMIGCNHSTTPVPTGVTPIVTMSGETKNDAFYFTAKIGANKDTLQEQVFHLDTGAFELLLTKPIADALKLPNEGNENIAGVTGNSPAYKSHVTLQLAGDHGTVEYVDVPCVVDPAFTGEPLFGLRFFIDQQLALTLNVIKNTLTLTHAE